MDIGQHYIDLLKEAFFLNEETVEEKKRVQKKYLMDGVVVKRENEGNWKAFLSTYDQGLI